MIMEQFINIHAYLNWLEIKNKPVFFIEIGAMDGVRYDLLHDYIECFNWGGIFVEPVKEHFSKLEQNYQYHDNIFFENSAIAETDGIKQIYKVDTNAITEYDLPEWLLGTSSLFNDRNAIGGNDGLLWGIKMDNDIYDKYKNHIIQENIQCITFDQLINKYNINKIDIIQIDTEGYDFIIFNQIDLTKYKPSIIKLEIINLHKHELDQIIDTLRFNGYNYFYDDYDIYAYIPIDIDYSLFEDDENNYE